MCEDPAAFKRHKVVPDVILTEPSSFLKVSYCNDVDVCDGNELTPTQVKAQPTLNWPAEDTSLYTLIMSDPDAPSRKEPKFREYLHWSVGNIPGNNVDKGDVLCAYVGSGPPKGTGLHRYVFLLFKQPQRIRFREAVIPKNSGTNRPKFSTSKFALKYNLGDPIAGNFYLAQYDDYVPTVHKQLSG